MNPFTSGSDKHTKILKVERGRRRLGESVAGLGLSCRLCLLLTNCLMSQLGFLTHFEGHTELTYFLLLTDVMQHPRLAAIERKRFASPHCLNPKLGAASSIGASYWQSSDGAKASHGGMCVCAPWPLTSGFSPLAPHLWPLTSGILPPYIRLQPDGLITFHVLPPPPAHHS